MGEITSISWCDHTFNPWIGCTKVSPACDGCYAEAMMDKRYGRVEWGAPGKGNGTRARTSAGNWHQPVRWNKKAIAEGTRPFVFCSSLADVFDNQIPVEWRLDLFTLIKDTPNLTWLLLTKRPQNIVKMFEQACIGDQLLAGETLADHWPRNAAIGTTCEDQTRLNLNAPHLLRAKSTLKPAFAFLSCEPLLGPIDAWLYLDPLGLFKSRIDWVITGGETDQGGHKARPTNPQWFRALRDQCADAGAAYHHKQNGEWMPFLASDIDWFEGRKQAGAFADRPEMSDAVGWPMQRVGKGKSGRALDGVEHDARPAVAA
jgi:protein gp37